MINYINEAAFYRWYAEVTGKKADGNTLQLVFEQYCSTGKAVFTLAANQTLTGRAEEYAYRFENVGCCGASTIYLTF